MTDTTTTDNITTELTTLEQQAAQVPSVQHAAEDISAELDYLQDVGADARALDVIHNSAADLFDASQQLGQAFGTAISLAQRIKQQRDAASEALSDLKQAVADADVSVPEIGRMFESIEEMMVETTQYWMMDMQWEMLVDELINVSSLSEDEASYLANVLLGQEAIPDDHPLWDDLRQWIVRAKEVGRGK